MNREELLELINSKIAGQGSAVDIGGALAPVLTELVTNLANMPTTYIAQIEDVSTYEIPEDILDSIQIGDQLVIKINADSPIQVEGLTNPQVMVFSQNGMKQVIVQWFLAKMTTGVVTFQKIEATRNPETGWAQSYMTGTASID